jgi:hypothetical protein
MTLSSSPSPPPEVPPLQGTAGALVDNNGAGVSAETAASATTMTTMQGAVSSHLGGILALLVVSFLAAAARDAVASCAMQPPAWWSWAGAAARESPREAARLAIAGAAWVAAAAAALLLEDGGSDDEATAQAQELDAEITSPPVEIAPKIPPPPAEIAARVSPPLAELAEQISPPHAEMAADISLPLAELEAEISPPLAGLAAQISPPQAEMAADISLPLAELEAEISPPLAEMAAQNSPPYAEMAAEISPPLAELAARISPPLAEFAAQISPPLAMLDAQISPPPLAELAARISSALAELDPETSPRLAEFAARFSAALANLDAQITPPLTDLSAQGSPPLAELAAPISSPFVGLDDERLRILMPTRPDRVVPFSQELDAFKERNESVKAVDIHLRASAALPPCAGALASFLRDLSFSADRQCSFNLLDDDREEAPAWSPDKVEAALAMVQAYLDNPTVTGPRMLKVPASSLRRELVDIIFRSASPRRLVRVYLSDTGTRAGNLYVKSGDVELTTLDGPELALALLRIVLLMPQSQSAAQGGSGGLSMPGELQVIVDGSTLPAAVRAFQDRRSHDFQELHFDAWRWRDRVDGTSLLAAAMLCPAARRLKFRDFSLASWEPVVRQSAGHGALDPLESLELVHCYIGRGGPPGATLGASPRSVDKLELNWCAPPATADAPTGWERDYSRQLPLDYTIDLFRTLSVLDVDLVGADLDAHGMSLLCDLLTGGGCRVRQLRLGPSPLSPGNRVTDDAVGLFFQRLPSMLSLKDLELHHVAPARLFETILTGVRRNRHLTTLRRLSVVPSDRDANRDRMRVVQFYVRANARGRSAVRESVMHPNDPALRAAAVEAIAGLARSASRRRRRRRDLSVLAQLVRDYVPAHAPALARGAAAAETNRPPPLPPGFLADAEP